MDAVTRTAAAISDYQQLSFKTFLASKNDFYNALKSEGRRSMPDNLSKPHGADLTTLSDPSDAYRPFADISSDTVLLLTSTGIVGFPNTLPKSLLRMTRSFDHFVDSYMGVSVANNLSELFTQKGKAFSDKCDADEARRAHEAYSLLLQMSGDKTSRDTASFDRSYVLTSCLKRLLI
ncbi:uncharacterized protein I303_108091 [Kwoniella dejecticola CBS 10117]|uniref:Uncharacterized protein n=1 Tax=Kwoniella dejecticola CBS 10117 TaxID=1296121 RepID=A0A1A5ZWI2_9TREE|nr:uncharacterized protein I303_08082 [Kwoniella dejecticola CBS 10117]OBR82168.1 hypothetical protein I303_08082 [Kwoniella dejecticola CBS 10117]